MNVDTEGISCCFDQESEKMLRDYRKKGLSETALAIANSKIKDRLAGSTVLELGCGFGGLMLRLVEEGASGAIGIDLSPMMIQAAQVLAAEKGLSDSVTFQLGDGAEKELPMSDIVVLDKVLCCYPDIARLVDASSSAAGRYYAVAVPDDERLITRTMKFFLPLQRLVSRRGGFRFFIHPTAKLRSLLEEKGLRLESKSRVGWIWGVFVFKRS